MKKSKKNTEEACWFPYRFGQHSYLRFFKKYVIGKDGILRGKERILRGGETAPLLAATILVNCLAC